MKLYHRGRLSPAILTKTRLLTLTERLNPAILTKNCSLTLTERLNPAVLTKTRSLTLTVHQEPKYSYRMRQPEMKRKRLDLALQLIARRGAQTDSEPSPFQASLWDQGWYTLG